MFVFPFPLPLPPPPPPPPFPPFPGPNVGLAVAVKGGKEEERVVKGVVELDDEEPEAVEVKEEVPVPDVDVVVEDMASTGDQEYEYGADNSVTTRPGVEERAAAA